MIDAWSISCKEIMSPTLEPTKQASYQERRNRIEYATPLPPCHPKPHSGTMLDPSQPEARCKMMDVHLLSILFSSKMILSFWSLEYAGKGNLNHP